jgi:hypothetical protein
MPNSPMNVVQQFMQFKQQMQGKDPQKIVEQMLADGQMSQQQFEQLKQQAEQFKGIFY